MFKRNSMHAFAASFIAFAIIATSTLGSMQDVFARTIEFKFDFGETKSADAASEIQINTANTGSTGSIAGISYDKLVMANVEEAVNVRSEASEKSDLIGKLYTDCGGEIIERTSGWTKLKSGDLVGYVKDDYLLFGNNAKALAEKVVEKTAISKTDSLRVRKSPSTDASILSLLAEGDKIEAVGTEGDWVKVEFADGEIGYVSADFVTVEDSLDFGETIETIKAKEAALLKEKEEKVKEEKISSQNLKAPTGAVNNGAIQGDVNDTLLLAALIQAEAGSQPYEGQVSVGTVVMNRLRMGKYGNNLYSVIYAKGQFGPAGSGKVAQIYAAGPKATCIQAATDAMNGVSYIGPATHFRNVNSGYSGIVIGSHVFW